MGRGKWLVGWAGFEWHWNEAPEGQGTLLEVMTGPGDGNEKGCVCHDDI